MSLRPVSYLYSACLLTLPLREHCQSIRLASGLSHSEILQPKLVHSLDYVLVKLCSSSMALIQTVHVHHLLKAANTKVGSSLLKWIPISGFGLVNTDVCSTACGLGPGSVGLRWIQWLHPLENTAVKEVRDFYKVPLILSPMWCFLLNNDRVKPFVRDWQTDTGTEAGTDSDSRDGQTEDGRGGAWNREVESGLALGN